MLAVYRKHEWRWTINITTKGGDRGVQGIGYNVSDTYEALDEVVGCKFPMGAKPNKAQVQPAGLSGASARCYAATRRALLGWHLHQITA